MAQNLNKAKHMYLAYGTSGYQMAREGVIEEYKSYNISKKQEDIWRIELLQDELSKLDINNFDSTFTLCFVIQNHLDITYLEKFIKLINKNISNLENQYTALRFGQKVYSLLFQFVRNKSNISKNLKLYCLETCEKLLLKTKHIELPNNFSIPHFTDIGQGLTQKQYILRKIVELEYDIEKAKILK